MTEKHPGYGSIPGNQEPNTPDVRESDPPRRREERDGEHHGAEHRGADPDKHPEYGSMPGNQEPNTPEVRESDQR